MEAFSAVAVGVFWKKPAMDVCLLDDDFFKDGVWGIFAAEDCLLVMAIDFQA